MRCIDPRNHIIERVSTYIDSDAFAIDYDISGSGAGKSRDVGYRAIGIGVNARNYRGRVEFEILKEIRRIVVERNRRR